MGWEEGMGHIETAAQNGGWEEVRTPGSPPNSERSGLKKCVCARTGLGQGESGIRGRGSGQTLEQRAWAPGRFSGYSAV